MEDGKHVEKLIQVKFKTEESEYAVPDTELSIPLNLGPDGLNKLIKGLLKEGGRIPSPNLPTTTTTILRRNEVSFYFVLFQDLIRGTLQDFLKDKDEVSESVYEIHYYSSCEPPEPEKCEKHEDWIGGVSSNSYGYVVSGSYDGKVTIWDIKNGDKKLTIPAHGGPTKSVVWIKTQQNEATFATTSHDQLINLYKWNINENTIEIINECKGHDRSVDCIAVDPSSTIIASGSFDNNVKIWGAEPIPQNNDDKNSPVSRSPITTLKGHKEGISGISFLDSKDEIITASWDHTIKIWDSELGGMKSEIVGNKSFFDLSYSPINKMLLTASADRFIRIYDPRSSAGTIVKNTYSSHKGWVTCVDWNKEKEHYFVSGAHDNLIKMWDSRSTKTPLYDLAGHSDKVFCVDWSTLQYIVSGGADSEMKIFKSNMQ